MSTGHAPLASADRTPEPDRQPEPDTVLDGLLKRTLSTSAQAIHGVALGRIVSVGVPGPNIPNIPNIPNVPNLPLVRLDILGPTPVPAQVACPLPDASQCVDKECAVLFVDGDPARPLIVGLVLTPPDAQNMDPIAPQFPAPERELRVDGERIVIDAGQELELRCGESVILLQQDGRIEIRGNYVTSQATATQRIRGGSVHVN